MRKIKRKSRSATLKEIYPAIAEYVSGWGWIEVGRDEMNRSFVRALDDGGLVWESPSKTRSADMAFEALEAALKKIMTQNA